MTLIQLYNYIESILPPLDIEGIDSDGIHVLTDPNRQVKRVLVALDPYDKAVRVAIEGGYDLLLTHHPLFWGEPAPDTPPEHWYKKLTEASVAAFSFHIRLDKSQGGVNDVLAKTLGLTDIVPFDEPEIPGLGRIGNLPEPMTEKQLAAYVKTALGADQVTYTLLPDGRLIKRVAVLGGSASDAVSAAAQSGADAIVGGEFKHHTYGYAQLEGTRGIAVIEAGHYHTEAPVCERLKDIVLSADPDICVDILPCNNTFVI